jgi:hypothetical protein
MLCVSDLIRPDTSGTVAEMDQLDILAWLGPQGLETYLHARPGDFHVHPQQLRAPTKWLYAHFVQRTATANSIAVHFSPAFSGKGRAGAISIS